MQRFFSQFSQVLNLKELSFRQEGYLTIADMQGPHGSIQVICGPPEYRAEIFVTSVETGKRLGLPELYEIKSVRDWLESYKSTKEKLTKIEADVEWVFRLLANGLKESGEFAWLYK
jgi:hypothetical protein